MPHYERLRDFAVDLGDDIALAAQELCRGEQTNAEWGEVLETTCEDVASTQLHAFANEHDYSLQLVTMPFKPKAIAHGQQGEDKTIKRIVIGDGSKKVGCLYDTVDSTWNAKAGLEYTAGSMFAFTPELEEFPEEYCMGDFSLGVIALHHENGVYHAERGSGEAFFWDRRDDVQIPLRLTEETDTNNLRCIIDTMTAQTKQSKEKALAIVEPIRGLFVDNCRLYGSALEFTSFMGKRNADPPYGGYIAPNQKADNIIPPLLILRELGFIATNWAGRHFDDLPIGERVDVIGASNATLHATILPYVRGKSIL